jgi:hypothetical protein
MPETDILWIKGGNAVHTIFELQGHMVICPVSLLPGTGTIFKKIEKGESVSGLFALLPFTFSADSFSVYVGIFHFKHIYSC